MPKVLSFYEDLVDPGYEDGRDERLLQARELLKAILPLAPKGRQKLKLLDVGAGSGILVEAARAFDVDSEGIEPSDWLATSAQRLGLPVQKGILPDSRLQGPFDIITVVDVIEHVEDPAALLRTVGDILAQDGVLAIVTPDASSLAARMMGWRWWHYRTAHIGYFNFFNLQRLCSSLGFETVKRKRPGWYFTVGYLRKRLLQYLPRWALPSVPGLDAAVVPLNLRDSILLICRPKVGRSAAGTL
ncbi:class I SAM-dependent methyltransferase [Tardiphaga sp. 866_E4_N2_1]|uniref:class I SAM-dependent methyltransferase n=1 Tax=unclassified Tardiphaga TaxID=2631404 RepID=UPI003F2556EC